MLKRKILIIEVTDGRKIERDMTNISLPGVLVGDPANSEGHAQLCQMLCINGYTDVDNSSEKKYTHIAPSQIKSVSLELREEKSDLKIS